MCDVVCAWSRRDEGTILFDNFPPTANATTLHARLAKLFATDPRHSQPGFVNETLAIYPPANFTDHDHASRYWWAGVRLFGDLAMSCAARRTARWVSNITLRAADAADAYLYFLKRKLRVTALAEEVSSVPYGVFHGSELPLVFDSVRLLLDGDEKEIALDVMALWAAFADTGKPDASLRVSRGGGMPLWPRYDPMSDEALVIDHPVSVASGLKKAECDYWDRVHGW